MDRDVRWFNMPVGMQISNIGSEVERAIKWKKRGDLQKAENFCKKAIEFWRLSEADPKNKHRCGEFECAIEELQDYFLGDNIYQTNDRILERYYNSFLNRL